MKRHLCLTDSEYSSFMHVCGLYLAQFLHSSDPPACPAVSLATVGPVRAVMSTLYGVLGRMTM